MLQKEKKPWHSENVNVPIYLNSALKKKKNKTKGDPGGKMKQVLRFNVIKYNSSDGLRSEQEDGCGQGCAMLLLLLLRHSFVVLAWVQ